MLKWKTLKTKKLFYRKYPYKVLCNVKGGEYVSRYSLEQGLKLILKKIENDKHPKVRGVYRFQLDQFTVDDYVMAKRFGELLEPIKELKNVHTRSENHSVSIFSTDKITHDLIIEKLDKWVEEITEPDSDVSLNFLLSTNSIKIIVESYPKDFKFKVILKTSLTYDVRTKLVAWISKYPNTKILPSVSTFLWLSHHKKYVQEPFVYVSDDKMVTLLELYLGNKISRIEEFVLRTDIV